MDSLFSSRRCWGAAIATCAIVLGGVLTRAPLPLEAMSQPREMFAESAATSASWGSGAASWPRSW